MPFLFNFPNIPWSADDATTHLSAIIESRLTNLGEKYFLMMLAHQKIIELCQLIQGKYDSANNELKLENEYWELNLFLNHFLYEARSTLDILATILRYLYKKSTPNSFNSIDETGKHAKAFEGDEPFRRCLTEQKASQWISNLLSQGSNISLRDRAAHYTVAKVSFLPAKDKDSVDFRIATDMGKPHPRQQHSELPKLHETINEIGLGISRLLFAFKDNYTQKRIRSLLGIDPNAKGLFEI